MTRILAMPQGYVTASDVKEDSVIVVYNLDRAIGYIRRYMNSSSSSNWQTYLYPPNYLTQNTAPTLAELIGKLEKDGHTVFVL